MKNTRYLYPGTTPPIGMVSVSQLQSFMSCRKKWEYGYVDGLTPRIERPYLSIGKLCHKGMQVAMMYKWQNRESTTEEQLQTALKSIEEEHTKYLRDNQFTEEELPDVEQILTDARRVFTQAFKEFDSSKYEVVTLCDKGNPIPALELHFKVPCPPTKGLHGYIDAILVDKDTGFTWCTDYKFRKSLSPDEEEENNIQNAVYAYACNKMGINITGTMTWQHLNTPAAVPQLLKNRTISRAKIKTTWDMYSATCKWYGLDPKDYEEEMVPKLAEIEWYRATYEYRNDETIKRMWEQCIVPFAKAVKRASTMVNPRSIYPWNCKMCQYGRLCQAELRDYDSDYIRKTEYVTRCKDDDNKPLDGENDIVV